MNIMKKILGNSKGFSIIQAIIAAGVVGAASVGVMHMSENQLEEIVYLETKQEEAALSKQIERLLMQRTACRNTFNGQAFGSTVAAIQNVSNTAVFEAGTNVLYGGGAITIESIALENDTVNPTPALGRGSAWAVVTLRRVKRKNGPEEIVTRIKLKAEADGASLVTNCYTDVSQYVDESLNLICTNLGGVLNANDLCDLTCANNPTDAVSATCLAARITNEFDVLYLPKGGGVISGNLDFSPLGSNTQSLSAEVISGSELCVGANCRNFAATNCTSGQIVTGINADGTVYCANITCPPGTYLRGLDNSGAQLCYSLPDQGCPPNYYAAEALPDGTPRCEPLPPDANAVETCPSGNYILSIDSAGVPTCVPDRKVETSGGSCALGFAISSISSEIASCTAVSPDRNVFGQDCGSGGYLLGFDSSGSALCQGAAPPCTDSTWTPDTSTECDGVAMVQTSDCGNTRSATGTSTTGACAPAICTGSLPTYASSCNSTEPTADEPYSHLAGCTSAQNRCDFQCDAGYSWDGSACVSSAICNAQNTFPRGATATTICPPEGYNGMDPCCTGASCSGAVPANASTCEVWELEYDQTWTIGSNTNQACSEAANVCEFDCDPGFTWDGSACNATTYSCTGTVATNATACGVAGTALTMDRAYVHNATCAGSGDSCEYQCNSGYTWDGTACVAYVCTGSPPTNAVACAGTGVNLTSNRPYNLHNESCNNSNDRCEYRCDATSTWDGTSCVVNPPPTYNLYNCNMESKTDTGYPPSGVSTCGGTGTTNGGECTNGNNTCYVPNSGSSYNLCDCY